MDEEAGKNVEFETISAEKIPFGKNNFIEVARKRAVSKDGETEFLSISRGYVLRDGSERYKRSLTIPDEKEIKDFIAQMLTSL